MANQVRDSFLQPILLSMALVSDASIVLITSQILLEIAGCTSKGDASDYCLDVFVDWMQSGLTQYFVAHPKESACRLLEAERSHLSQQSVRLLEVPILYCIE